MVTLTQSVGKASTIEILKSSIYFTELDNFVLDKISRLMTERTVEKHEIIWLEQDPAKKVYFVVSGQIKLFKMSTDGKEQIVRLACPGDSLGHTGIFNGGSNPESAQAMIPSVLWGIAKNDLETLLWDHKQLAINTIRAMAIEMHHYMSLVEDLSLRRVSGRLARLLLEHNSEGVFDESLILTRGDMASMTGTVREVFGKSLKVLEENGIIESNRRQIIIKGLRQWRAMSIFPQIQYSGTISNQVIDNIHVRGKVKHIIMTLLWEIRLRRMLLGTILNQKRQLNISRVTSHLRLVSLAVG